MYKHTNPVRTWYLYPVPHTFVNIIHIYDVHLIVLIAILDKNQKLKFHFLIQVIL